MDVRRNTYGSLLWGTKHSRSYLKITPVVSHRDYFAWRGTRYFRATGMIFPRFIPYIRWNLNAYGVIIFKLKVNKMVLGGYLNFFYGCY
jgi:hypothetical protein